MTVTSAPKKSLRFMFSSGLLSLSIVMLSKKPESFECFSKGRFAPDMTERKNTSAIQIRPRQSLEERNHFERPQIRTSQMSRFLSSQ